VRGGDRVQALLRLTVMGASSPSSAFEFCEAPDEKGAHPRSMRDNKKCHSFYLQDGALGNFSVACACALVFRLSNVLLISFHRVISFVASYHAVSPHHEGVLRGQPCCGALFVFSRVVSRIHVFYSVGRARPLRGNGQSGAQTHVQPTNQVASQPFSSDVGQS
jgi:hypothetical protein